MNIAMTGSNGFIGNHLKHLILSMGFQLITISNNKYENDENNYSYDEFFSGSANLKIDIIIHLASPNYDYANDDSLKKGISGLTNNIISNMYKHDCKKIIYFSSAKVYGEPSFKEIIYDESSILKPTTEYGKEKVKAEGVIQLFSKNRSLEYIIYRMPMVYGPNMNSNIGKIFCLIDKSCPIPFFKTKKNYKKSLLSIENIKKCIEYNLKNPDSINDDIINLADNGFFSFEDILKNYKKISKSRSLILKLPNFVLTILVKIPFLEKPITKLFGNFQLNNDKINKVLEKKLLNTNEGFSMLTNSNNSND